jgi:TRAP-type C4-dicarboxylate transport system substrate-binding protein
MHLLHVQRGALHYNIFTKKPVSSLDDFKGFRLRVAPSHIPFATAVGADIINIEISEVYTSLERGIVDGFAFVDAGITNFGFEEQINHYITPYIYEGDTSLIVNRNVWESLPQDVQELLLEWSKEAEAQYIAAVEEVRNQELEKFKELGITEINLGDELQQVALEAGWSHLQETSPETYEKLRELFTKQ